MSTRFVPETPKKVNHILTEALEKKRNACSKAHHEYVFDRKNDKQTVECSILSQKHPNMVRDTLINLTRVKLVPEVFELDESGNTVDSKGKAKEALVWSIARKVMDPNNPYTVALGHCTIQSGVYSRPFTRIERGDQGEVIKSEIVYWGNRFYVPFSKEKVMEVINVYGGSYRNTVLAQAQATGEFWHTGKTWNVPNLKEFLEIDWHTLQQANISGVLTSEYGGHIRFLKEQKAKREQLEAEVKQFPSEQSKSSKK